jgi:hypothetical protein
MILKNQKPGPKEAVEPVKKNIRSFTLSNVSSSKNCFPARYASAADIVCIEDANVFGVKTVFIIIFYSGFFLLILRDMNVCIYTFSCGIRAGAVALS